LSKKLCLVVGNGFSMDFLNHIDKPSKIDLINLFIYGPEVPWPSSGTPGFLSFKHCPHLWNLGARPNMSAQDAMALIEDIITCVNVHSSQKTQIKRGQNRPNDIYIYAYQELLQYLKHLFIFYDRKLEHLPKKANSWAWLDFIKKANNSDDYSEITIITYNYDIWLERLLSKNSIPFNVGCIGPDDPNVKITILKPHGSISFIHQHELDKDSYSIKLDNELLNGPTTEFSVSYENLDNNYLVSALIPPAGDSSRFNQTWAGQIRETAKQKASELSKDDEIILCGLSYWHVDRAELDELIVSCDPLINISMVNPSPQRTLNAVLTSIFSNFIAYTGSGILKDKITCTTL
jgi:hypothetical protein